MNHVIRSESINGAFYKVGFRIAGTRCSDPSFSLFSPLVLFDAHIFILTTLASSETDWVANTHPHAYFPSLIIYQTCISLSITGWLVDLTSLNMFFDRFSSLVCMLVE